MIRIPGEAISDIQEVRQVVLTQIIYVRGMCDKVTKRVERVQIVYVIRLPGEGICNVQEVRQVVLTPSPHFRRTDRRGEVKPI